MNSIEFSAIFESKENGISEMGQAYIAADNSVTFTSDFVPLVKLGTTVSITRILGDKKFERFTGKVYLSSRKLIRIVDVDHKLIEQAMALFESNAIVPAEFDVMPARLFRFGSKNQKPVATISGFVRYISPTTVRICTMEYAEAGQQLVFTTEDPHLAVEKFTVVIKERMLLMRSAALLICETVSLSENNRAAIQNYINQKRIEDQL